VQKRNNELIKHVLQVLQLKAAQVMLIHTYCNPFRLHEVIQQLEQKFTDLAGGSQFGIE
jgi:hypothetical protein